ncbi:MAG: hypothetical protein MI861_23855 [Pirellulales bacterium]|nr:hypothetical protein [Pirellulales bacterium]
MPGSETLGGLQRIAALALERAVSRELEQILEAFPLLLCKAAGDDSRPSSSVSAHAFDQGESKPENHRDDVIENR